MLFVHCCNAACLITYYVIISTNVIVDSFISLAAIRNFALLYAETWAPAGFFQGGEIHRRSQDFLWGCTSFVQKVDLFLVVALTTQARNTK